MNKKSKYLKVLLLAIAFTFFNCQKEDDAPAQQQFKELNKNLKISTLSGKDINKNTRLMEGIDDVAKMNFTNKQVDNETYGFTINTNFAKVIDDGTTKTYTFGVYRDEDNGLLENLFMVEKNDGSFDVSLVQYDLTPQEIEALNNREIIDVEGKITFVALDDISGDVLGKYYYNGNCYENNWVYNSGSSCDSGRHEYTDGDECDYWGNPNKMATSGGYVLTPTIVSCSNGGGGDNTNNPNGDPNGNPNDTSGSGPNTGGSTSIITCTRNCIGEECNDTLEGILALLSLNEEQACWLNASQQSSIKQEIIDYLNGNGSLEFAEIAIEDLRENDCAFLPTISDVNQMTVDFTGMFGDVDENPNQIDHTVVKANYETLFNADDKLDAVNYLINTYSLDVFGSNTISTNYTYVFDPADTNEANTTCNILVNTNTGSFSVVNCVITLENGLLTHPDFAYTVRSIKHELLHVLQRETFGNGISSAAMEFDAYYYSMFRFKGLPVGTNHTYTRWARRVQINWKQLSETEKNQRQVSYNKFSEYFPEICKE